MNASIGHNNAPPVAGDYSDLQARISTLVESFSSAPQTIESDDVAEKVTDLTKMLKEATKKVELARKTEKDPFLESGRQVDAYFANMADPAERAAKDLEKRLGSYRTYKAELERKRLLEEAAKARAEAERVAAEAAQLEAAGMQEVANNTMAEAQKTEDTANRLEAASNDEKQLGKVRGEYGKTVATKRWAFEIDNFAALDLNALRSYIDSVAVEKAIRAYVAAGGRQLAGVSIFQQETVSVR